MTTKPSLSLPPELQHLPRPTRISLGILGLAAVLAATLLPYLLGALDDLELDLRRLRGETAQVRAETTQARRDYQFVVENRDRYNDALTRGLFQPQDRLQAKALLNQLYQRDYLAALSYEFANQTVERKGTSEIATTPVRLSVGAILDRDIYTFMRDVAASFPGVVVLRNMTITPMEAVGPATLRNLRNGVPVSLFRAELSYDWRTANAPASRAGGKAP